MQSSMLSNIVFIAVSIFAIYYCWNGILFYKFDDTENTFFILLKHLIVQNKLGIFSQISAFIYYGLLYFTIFISKLVGIIGIMIALFFILGNSLEFAKSIYDIFNK